MEPQIPEPIVPQNSEPAPFTTPPTPPAPAEPMARVEVKKGFPLIPVIAVSVLILAAIIFVIVRLVVPNLGKGGAGDSGTVTGWNLWENQETFQPLIDEYQAQHPNVKVNFVAQSKEDYRERLTNALARGTGPEIFAIHNTWDQCLKTTSTRFPRRLCPQVNSQAPCTRLLPGT